jgi:hypothetical protein
VQEIVMAGLLFLIAFVLPPAVIALSAAALAIGSIARRSESTAPLREQHA